MSDDEHDHTGPPFPFGPPPPEIIEELKRRKELAHMAEEDAVARQNQLIDKLDGDDLVTLRRMLMTTIGDDSDNFAAHMAGWIGSVLHYKFDICLACGRRHEDLTIEQMTTAHPLKED